MVKKSGFYSKYNWKPFEIWSKRVMRSYSCLNGHFAVYTIDYREEKGERWGGTSSRSIEVNLGMKEMVA